MQLRRNDFGSPRRRTPQTFGANGGLPAALQGGQSSHGAFAHNNHGKSWPCPLRILGCHRTLAYSGQAAVAGLPAGGVRPFLVVLDWLAAFSSSFSSMQVQPPWLAARTRTPPPQHEGALRRLRMPHLPASVCCRALARHWVPFLCCSRPRTSSFPPLVHNSPKGSLH